MKNLLIISPYFPPIGGSGVFRLFRWVKYLPEFGIRPIVVHYHQLPGEPEAPELLSELSEEVVRYPVFFLEFSGRGFRSLLKKKSQSSGQEMRALPGSQGFFLRSLSWVRDRLLVPDLSLSWLFPLIPRLRKLVQEYQPGVVLSTYSPGASHLAGLYLKSRFGHKWIADFRDLWTDAPQEKPLFWGLRHLDQFLERQTLKRADLVIGYSKGLLEILARKVQKENQDKFIVLGPALEEKKFDQIPPAEEQFDLIYTGYLTDAYPWQVFDYLYEINQGRRKSSEREIKVGVAGKVSFNILKRFQEFERAGWFKYLGYLSHPETLSLLKSSRGLLLLHPFYDWWVPGKVAEYLYSKKPILAVVGEGDLKEILRGYPGVVFAKKEPGSFKKALSKVLALEEQERVLPKEFTARGQAEIIAEKVNQLWE